MALTFREVDQILRIIEEFPASEVRFEYGDLKIHVRRAGSDGPRQPVALAPSRPERPAAQTATASSTASPPAPPEAAKPEVRKGLIAVTSPMMGVFYSAPSPGAEPCVKAGQAVAKGDDIGIIEVMKIMNMIRAPCAGTVVEVVAQNAQTVASGAALVWIRPSGETK